MYNNEWQRNHKCHGKVKVKIKMEKIYEVVHLYDVDGGFGDAIGREDVIARFAEESKAKEIVEKYAKPHIYEKPYASLYCGELVVHEVELDVYPEEKSMWWLRTKSLEDDWDEDDEDDDWG